MQGKGRVADAAGRYLGNTNTRPATAPTTTTEVMLQLNQSHRHHDFHYHRHQQQQQQQQNIKCCSEQSLTSLARPLSPARSSPSQAPQQVRK
jgi:hypothetical protein